MGRTGLLRALAIGLVAAGGLVVAGMPRPARGHADGPPPGYTGGFGEPTCRLCHFDAPEKPEAGELTIEGVPAAYRPGAEYPIEITLRDPRLERAGFQLAVRFAGREDESGSGGGPAAGRQAGRLLASGPRAEVVELREPPVLYARQTQAGADPTAPHEATWTLRWVAPEEPAGAVLFHAAANAANHDDSELGDTVHPASGRSEPAEPERERQKAGAGAR